MAAGRIGIAAANSVKRVPCFIRVTRGDGRPLADARIAVEQADGPVPEIMYVAGKDGNVQIGLPEGRVVLRIFAHGKSSRAELQVSSEPEQFYTVRVDVF